MSRCRRAVAGWGVVAGITGAFGIAALYKGLAIGRMGVVAPVASVVTAVLPVLFGFRTEGLPDRFQIAGICSWRWQRLADRAARRRDRFVSRAWAGHPGGRDVWAVSGLRQAGGTRRSFLAVGGGARSLHVLMLLIVACRRAIRARCVRRCFPSALSACAIPAPTRCSSRPRVTDGWMWPLSCRRCIPPARWSWRECC